MKKAIYYSLGLHGLIIVFMILGLPSFKHDVQHDYAIVTEVVPITELSNINVHKKRDAQKAPEEVKTSNQSETKKTAQPAKVEDDVKLSIPSAKKESKKTQEAQTKQEKSKKAADKKNKAKPEEEFASAILKSLDSKPKAQEVEEEFKKLEKKLHGATNKAFNENMPMSISEIDSIKSQISDKWNTTSFSGGASSGMQVTIRAELDLGANVVSVRSIDGTGSENPHYRAFVESAMRAIRMASPLQNLSSEKFHNWKEIELRFDSSGMIY